MSATFNKTIGGRRQGKKYARPTHRMKAPYVRSNIPRSVKRNTSTWNNSVRSKSIMGNTAQATLTLNIPAFKLTLSGANVNPPFGSKSLAILCNSIAPFDQTYYAPLQGAPSPPTNQNIGQLAINPNTWLLQGLQQYTPYFDKYYVTGCKVKCIVYSDPIQAPPAGQIDSPIQLFGAAFKLNGQGAQSNLNPDVLDALQPIDMQNQKGTQVRTISNSGGKNAASITLKRSTKKICGITDVKDNIGYQGTLNRENLSTVIESPEKQWFNYFRIQNGSTADQTLNVSFQISSYVTFTNRKVWHVGKAESPIGPGGE